jgi:hypothetical protein
VPRLAVATRCATYCLERHPIGNLPVIECKYEGWIGRWPWVLVFSITGCGIEYPTRMHSFFNSRGENIFVSLIQCAVHYSNKHHNYVTHSEILFMVYLINSRLNRPFQKHTLQEFKKYFNFSTRNFIGANKREFINNTGPITVYFLIWPSSLNL